MSLEDGSANETFTGALWELIERAWRRDAEEIHQWSPVERTYVPLTKADERSDRTHRRCDGTKRRG